MHHTACNGGEFYQIAPIPVRLRFGWNGSSPRVERCRAPAPDNGPVLHLYHAEPVANSMKSLLCLKEKGLDFHSHYVDLLRFEQHGADFVKLNPNGQVPVLVLALALPPRSTKAGLER